MNSIVYSFIKTICNWLLMENWRLTLEHYTFILNENETMRDNDIC